MAPLPRKKKTSRPTQLPDTNAHLPVTRSQTTGQKLFDQLREAVSQSFGRPVASPAQQARPRKPKGKGQTDRMDIDGASQASASPPDIPTRSDNAPRRKNAGKGKGKARSMTVESRSQGAPPFRGITIPVDEENEAMMVDNESTGPRTTTPTDNLVQPIQADASGIYKIKKAMVSALKFTPYAFRALFEREDVSDKVALDVKHSSAVAFEDGKERGNAEWQQRLGGRTLEEFARQSFEIGLEQGEARANAAWLDRLQSEHLDADMTRTILSMPMVVAAIATGAAAAKQEAATNAPPAPSRLDVLTDDSPLDGMEMNALLTREEVQGNKPLIVHVLKINVKDVLSSKSTMKDEDIEYIAARREFKQMPAKLEKFLSIVGFKPFERHFENWLQARKKPKSGKSGKSNSHTPDTASHARQGETSATKLSSGSTEIASAAEGSFVSSSYNYAAQQLEPAGSVTSRSRVPLGPLQEPNTREAGFTPGYIGKAESAQSLKRARRGAVPYNRGGTGRAKWQAARCNGI